MNYTFVHIYVSSPKGAHLDRKYITGTRFGTSTGACIYTFVVRNMYHSVRQYNVFITILM